MYELEKKSNNNSKQKDKENHLGYIWKLLSFNENFFISAGRDKTICIWNKKYERLQKIEAHENSVTCLDQLTKKSFISGSRDKTIKLWELKGKNQFELKDTFNFHSATVLSLCKITDDVFASSGADNNINIYNIKEKSIKTLYGHNNWVWNILKLSENILVSCSEDRTIKIWDLEKYECLQTIEEKNPIHSLAFDHKNNILFSGNEKGVINLRLEENDFIKEKKLSFKAHNGIIKNILIIDGKILASCGEDNKVNLIDIKTKKRIFSYKHNNFVQSLILFKDTLISASYDGIIKKLDLKKSIDFNISSF